MRIDCSDIAGGDPSASDAVRSACSSLSREGFVVLDHVIDRARIQALHAEFTASYRKHLLEAELDDTLKIGNRRYMIPVELAKGFRDPLVYANPYVVDLVRQALEADAVLESFAAVVSLAGARQQHVHRDGRFLFDSTISALLPAHALTFVIPLVDMNEANGTIAVWPGSHRWSARDEEAVPFVVDVPAGSCVLWDLRTYYSGTSNCTDRPRPVLHGTYTRHWYQGAGGFHTRRQRHLAIDDSFLASVPADCRSLFDHVAPSA